MNKMKKLTFLTVMLSLMIVFSGSVSAQSNCVPKDKEVAFFVDYNYGGNCKVFKIGGYLDIAKAGFAEDQLSSFKVGKLVVLRLCREKRYQDQKLGGCKEYTTDVAALKGNSATPNDTASSFVVFARKPAIVTAEQVNGTWGKGESVIKILALGGGKLKVFFSIFNERNLNAGTADGEAIIEGIDAAFSPMVDGAKNKCKFTMKFTDGKLIVEQFGDPFDCGFGNGVSADGTYTKTSSAKPKFE
jgi:hypothetical protein